MCRPEEDGGSWGEVRENQLLWESYGNSVLRQSELRQELSEKDLEDVG